MAVTIYCPLFTAYHLLSSVLCHLSPVICPPSTVHCLPVLQCHLLPTSTLIPNEDQTHSSPAATRPHLTTVNMPKSAKKRNTAKLQPQQQLQLPSSPSSVPVLPSPAATVNNGPQPLFPPPILPSFYNMPLPKTSNAFSSSPQQLRGVETSDSFGAGLSPKASNREPTKPNLPLTSSFRTPTLTASRMAMNQAVTV